MTISIRSDAGGTSGAIQVNGTDALTINSNGSMTTPTVTSAAKRLRVSATGTDATVSISADELVLSDGAGTYKVLTSISLSASTSVSGTNGVDSGAAVGGVWYAVWVIWNGTTAASLLSTSSTAPTMPNGYTFKARVGWIRTDVNVNKYPRGLTQVGNSAQYRIGTSSNTPGFPQLSSGTHGNIYTPAFVTTPVDKFVPPTATKISIMAWSGAGVASTQMVAPSGQYGPYGGGYRTPILTVSSSASAASNGLYRSATFILESTNVYVAADHGLCGCVVLGWEDDL